MTGERIGVTLLIVGLVIFLIGKALEYYSRRP